jgi:hypothetical protein
MGKTTDILLRIGGDASGLKKALGDGSKGLKQFEGSVGSSVAAIGRLAGVLGLGLGLGKLIGDALEFADTMTKVSEQTGMSTDSVQRLNFIATQTGTTLDQITGAIGKMQNNLIKAADGSEKAAEALGMTRDEANAFLQLDPEAQFNKVAASIASMRNPADQTAAAIAVFGKSGAELLPTLKAIGEDAEKLAVQFDAIGGPVSADAIKAVDALGDEAAAAGLSAKSLATELLAMVAPAIIAGLQQITGILGGIRVLAGAGGHALVNATNDIAAAEAKLANIVRARGEGDAGFQARKAALEAELVLLKAKEQALIDAPYKEAQAKLEAAKVLPDPAQELEDIIVRADAKGLAKLDRETYWRIEEMKMNQAHDEAVEAYALEHAESLIAINEYAMSRITEFQAMSYSQQAATVFGELASVTQGVAQHNKTLFNINKAAGIANAIINTAQGVSQSLASYPMPLAGVMAAVHAAAGIAQVMAIKNAQYNGGGSGSAPSNATAVPTPTTPSGGGGGGGGAGNGQTLRVEGLSANSIISGSSARLIGEKVQEFVKDGGRVEFAS